MINIFEGTPYNSYTELVKLIHSGNAWFSFSRVAAYNVARMITNKALYLYFLAIFIAIIFVIAMSIISNVYLLLIIIPILLFFFIFVHKMPYFIILCAIVSLAGLFLNWTLWIITIPLSFIVISFGYYVWWIFVARIVTQNLLKNEEIFISMWKNRDLGIKDNKGNFMIYKMNESTSDDIIDDEFRDIGILNNNYIEYKKLIFNIDFNQYNSILRIDENATSEIGSGIRFRLLIAYTSRILQSCYPPQFLPIKKCLEDYYSSIENLNENINYCLTNEMFNLIKNSFSEHEKWAVNKILFENESNDFFDTLPKFEVLESDISTVQDKIFNYKITLFIHKNVTKLGIDMAINNPTKLLTLLSLGFISDYVLSNQTATSINYIKKPLIELLENINEQNFNEIELNNYIIKKHINKLVSCNLQTKYTE